MKRTAFTILLAIVMAFSASAASWEVSSGQTIGISLQEGPQVVGTALEILKKDFLAVLDAPVQICDASQADIVIRTPDNARSDSNLQKRKPR